MQYRITDTEQDQLVTCQRLPLVSLKMYVVTIAWEGIGQ